MQRRFRLLPLTTVVVLCGLSAGCFDSGETANFYTRSWYEAHLLLADRNEARTHFVALETSPPGFHYSDKAPAVPTTQLVMHAPEESIPVFQLTPEILMRWEATYFNEAEGHHSTSPQDDREFHILRQLSAPGLPRILTCSFRSSDQKLTAFEYRVNPAGVDLEGEIDPGPFSFSLGSGARLTLPISLEDAAVLFGEP